MANSECYLCMHRAESHNVEGYREPMHDFHAHDLGLGIVTTVCPITRDELVRLLQDLVDIKDLASLGENTERQQDDGLDA